MTQSNFTPYGEDSDFNLSLNFGDQDLDLDDSEDDSVLFENTSTRVRPKAIALPPAKRTTRPGLFDKKQITTKEETKDFKKKYEFKSFVEGEDVLTKVITQKQREKSSQSRTNHIDNAKILDLDILMSAPKGYFKKYEKDVKKGVEYCRLKIAEEEKAEIISDASNNPTDLAYQNKAYLYINRHIGDFIRSQTDNRGAHAVIVTNMIVNEILGFDIIDPLWNDTRITEIVCNGAFDIQVEIDGEMHKVESASFRDREHLSTLLERLFRSVGKTLAQATPQVKGRLHDKSRIFAVHESIAPEGPNFNIRRHPEGFWTPEALISRGASSDEMMEYLGNLIHKGASFIIAGGTSTGKALVHDTIIQTPKGQVTMGDIKVGDLVFDHNGNVCNVTNKFLQEPRQVYAVKLSTGNTVYADIEHNWLVSSHVSRKANIYRIRSKENNGGYQRKTKISSEKIENLVNLINSKEYPELSSVGQLEKLIGFSVSQKPSLMKKLADSDCVVDMSVRRKKYYTEKSLLIILEYSNETLNDQRHLIPDLWQVKTTGELIEEGVYIKTSKHSGRYNFRIPKLSKPVEYDNSLNIESFSVHPYLLGLWLGDGNSSGGVIAGVKEDIKEYSKELSDKGVVFFGKENHIRNRVEIHGKSLTTILKEMNLIEKEKGKTKKHVPYEYLYGTIDVRREIIAGLLDSDGYALSKSVGWEFCNTNKQLIDDFVQLVSSLGYKTRISKERYKTYELNGESFRTKKPSWTVTVLTEDTLAKLPRKIAKHEEMKALYPLSDDDVENISIVSIEPVEGRIEEMSCITVDSPDSTYLIGNHFTTTHNTSMLNALTGFYPEHSRILTLEDNLEMKPNPKKLIAAPMETKPPAPDNVNDSGVTMRSLVHSAMQMRPDVLIIGEVTDAAAYDLCQALNTGHAGASTFHANSSQLAITRVASLVAQSGLTTIDGAFDLISAAFDFVINLRHFPQDGSRRIYSIDEVGSEVEVVDGKPFLRTKQLWKFNTERIENNKVIGHWEQVGDISEERAERRMFDAQRTLSWEELKELSSLPEGHKTA